MWSLGNYTTDGLVVVNSMADDNWEDSFLDKLEEMLRNMGMPVTREQLKGFLNQFKANLIPSVSIRRKSPKARSISISTGPLQDVQRRRIH